MTALSPQDIHRLALFALDSADEAAVWSDADGRLLYANQTTCRTLGFRAEELVNTRFSQISAELTPALWAQLWKELRARDTFTFELTLNTKDGRVLPVEMTVRRLRLAKKDILCAFFRDVNERKRLQQLKNEFVSTVSHELRTPMTIIRESVSQVLDGLMGEVPPAQREILYTTLAGINRLARIINDLLDVSKMEAGKSVLRWERVNLAELVREIVATFASRAKERGLALTTQLPDRAVVAYADYDRLVQVFTNLVGNALKFSEKGTIAIAVRELDQEIVCAVSDTGIGIAQEDLERVFNKFEQLNQPAVTGERGSGLGLSICKSIIEMHQGSILASSRYGAGSTFTFTLPKRTAVDLFEKRMLAEMAQARQTGGNISAVTFDLALKKTAGSRNTGHLIGWAINELVETIKTQGARKTDLLLTDANTVWLGFLNMTKKEAARIIDQILKTYAGVMEKNDLQASIGVSLTQCSFPQDVKTEKAFFDKLLKGKKRDD